MTGDSDAPRARGRARASRRVPRDIRAAVAILLFCALAYGLTTTFDAVPAALAQGMGPAAFPRLVLIVIGTLAVVLALTAARRAEETVPEIPRVLHLTALGMVVVMGLIWLLGMAFGILAAIVGIGRLWGERRWSLLVGSGIALAVLIHVLFVRVFGIPLPQGILPQHFL